MEKETVPQEIFVLTALNVSEEGETRRGTEDVLDEDEHDIQRRFYRRNRRVTATSVNLGSLKEQVNLFIQQLNVVMEEAPEKVGKFSLTEFEVSAGIVVGAKGGIQLGLISEMSGEINASLKFTFSRKAK